MYSYKNTIDSASRLAELYLYGKFAVKNEEMSLKYLRENLENNPDNSDAWYTYAYFLYKWKRYIESLKIWFRGIEQKKTRQDVYYVIGLNFLKLGSEKTGIEYLDYMRSLGTVEAGEKLGKLYLKKYRNGDKSAKNNDIIWEGLLCSINLRKFKHFYDYFEVIQELEPQAMEGILSVFVGIQEYLDPSQAKEYLRFLIFECFKRCAYDVIETYVHPFYSYLEIARLFYHTKEIDKIIIAKGYLIKVVHEGNKEAHVELISLKWGV